MAYEEKTHAIVKPHNVIMEERCRLSVSGVEDVESFDENEMIIYTTKGTLIVRGTGLHVGKLSLDVGELTVEGLIDELLYEELKQTGGFWSRMFK